MERIDLNCDLGESFGAYTIGMDREIIPFISSANVACGYHASDPVVMDKTVKMAKEAGVAVGAHPGFPDLMGFGRRAMLATPTEVKAYVQYQIGALQAFLTSNNMIMQHVKPHGALYNMAGKDAALARSICEGVKEIDSSLIMLVPATSMMAKAAKEISLRVCCEVFADRAYEEDGSLVDRKKTGSVLTDEELVIDRVIRMIKEHKVTTITGKDIPIHADSVCVHGDGEKALMFVQKLRESFKKEDIQVMGMK